MRRLRAAWAGERASLALSRSAGSHLIVPTAHVGADVGRLREDLARSLAAQRDSAPSGGLLTKPLPLLTKPLRSAGSARSGGGSSNAVALMWSLSLPTEPREAPRRQEVC